MRVEKDKPDSLLYKVNYDENSAFSEITVTRNVRNRETSKPGYELPKAYTGPLPVSAAKLKDLKDLCKDLTIPAAHHSFYESLFSDDIEVEHTDEEESEDSD